MNQSQSLRGRQSPQSGLMTVKYMDSQKSISLSAYADTVVYGTVKSSDSGHSAQNGPGKKTLCAIRFGGYPEQVGGLVQAINGGGDVSIEVGGESVTLRPLMKQYRRNISHDGVYAEAVLIAEDENQQAKSQDKNEHENSEKGDDAFEEQIELDLPPRNSFIYTAPGDKSALYDAIDRKTGVPMIPAFSDYIIEELQKTGILTPLHVLSNSFKFDAWMLRCTAGDANIIGIVEKGVKDGKIMIPGTATSGNAGAFATVNSVTDYLSTFGPQVAERIKNLFVPLFDPGKDALSPEILGINETIREKAGYSLYEPQLAVAEAVKRQLQRGKVGLIIAECGAGKTKIGSTAIAAAVAGLRSDQQKRGKSKTFNVVLCPSHIKEKWVREIEETLPGTFACVVNNITEFEKLYAVFAKGGKHCYAIISKEMARDGYMHMPAVVWSKSKKAFICPCCDETVKMAISQDGARYIVDADQYYFKRQNRDNHKCESCGSPLWTALNPSAAHRSEWYKLADYGFVYRPQARGHLHKVKNAGFVEKIEALMGDSECIPNAVGAHRKYPLSTYIKKHYKGRIDGLIIDELHQYNNDSGQGDAMAELFSVSKKAVGMTGTLINGYASGIFYLLFRIMPGLMLEDGKAHSSPSDFIAEYGVVENTYESEEGDYNANRRTVKQKKHSKQLPGVSPLVYSRFLLEYAAFLSLCDMGKDLPDYEEIPIPLAMPDYVAKPYRRMQDKLSRFLKTEKKAAKKILSSYLNLLIAYPDQPYGQPPILHPLVADYPIVKPPDVADIGTILPKDEAVFDIVKRKTDAGERVLIYTNWTRLDTQEKLKKLLTEAGYHTEILPARVNPEKRERWVAERVAKGIQILITNPSLVETGLDLIPFTTLIFYDTGFKLFTLRQASRRSWRINQTYPRIEVFMLYYEDTMQHKAIKLMASKLAVAEIIEGGFSEEGLAAMSQCDDMTSQMAKELMLGIKDSVEDVSAAFKRMSVKRRTGNKLTDIFSEEPVKIGQVARDKPQIMEFTYSVPSVRAPRAPVVDISEMFASMPETAKKAKLHILDENQLSLFESIA
jgi:superfamily II DNA or RNA helicase